MPIRVPCFSMMAFAMLWLTLFLPAPAKADSVPAWQKRTIDKGCFLYQYEESYNGMESDPTPYGYLWSGPCTPGQPISGNGTLYEQVLYVDGKGKRTQYVRSMTGQLVDGFFEGKVQHLRHDVEASGGWDPDAGYARQEFEFRTYRGGCDVEGLADQYSDYSYCTPGRAEDPIIIPRVAQPYYPLPVSLVDTVGAPAFPPVSATQPAAATPDDTGLGVASPLPAPPLPPANTPRLGPAQTEQDRLWAQLPTRRTGPAAGIGMLADSTNPGMRAQRQQQVAQHQARQAQQRREREQRQGSGTGSALLGALLQTAATVAIVKHSPDATWALNSLAQSGNTEQANQRLMAGAVTALAGGDAQQVNQALSSSGYPAQLSQAEASQRLMAGTIAALSGGNSEQIGQALSGQVVSSAALSSLQSTSTHAALQPASNDGFSYTYVDGQCVGFGCPEQKSQPADPARQRRVHNPAADATSCVQLSIGDPKTRSTTVSQGRWFTNNCDVPVEIFWCRVDNGECDRELGGTWTVGVGRGWPAMTSSDIRWNACRGANSGSFDRGSKGTRYTCWNFD